MQVQISGIRISTVTDMAIANSQGQFVVDPGFLQVTDKGSNAYDPDTIYVTNGTSIYLTKNHGQTWVNRTSNLAGLGSIVDLEVDPRNRDTVYAVRNAFGSRNVFVSTDAGRTWSDITSNLPAASRLGTVPVWKLAVDPRNGFLYVGTDLGVFQSTDSGVVEPLRRGNAERPGQGFGSERDHQHAPGRDLWPQRLSTLPRHARHHDRAGNRRRDGPRRLIGLTGNVIVDGDPINNEVDFGEFGVQNLPNSIPVASLNFVGPISDLSADRPGATINKFGQGNVIFTGTNIYDGETFVEEGALVVDNVQASAAPPTAPRLSMGRPFALRSNLDAEPITLNGNGISFNDHFTGSLRNTAGSNTYTGPLTLATNATIGVDSGTQLDHRQFAKQLIRHRHDQRRCRPHQGTAWHAGSGWLVTTRSPERGAGQPGRASSLENSDAVGTTPRECSSSTSTQIRHSTLLSRRAAQVAVNAPLRISGSSIFGEERTPECRWRQCLERRHHLRCPARLLLRHLPGRPRR